MCSMCNVFYFFIKQQSKAEYGKIQLFRLGEEELVYAIKLQPFEVVYLDKFQFLRNPLLMWRRPDRRSDCLHRAFGRHISSDVRFDQQAATVGEGQGESGNHRRRSFSFSSIGKRSIGWAKSRTWTFRGSSCWVTKRCSERRSRLALSPDHSDLL